METKKALIRNLIMAFESELEIKPADLEIVIVESPLENWGIRGTTGDELQLTYTVNT